MAATHLLIHYVLYCASHARHIYHLCCGASPPLPSPRPLAAASSQCFKVLEIFWLSACRSCTAICVAAWGRTNRGALYFTSSVTRKLLHCSAGLHVGRAGPKVICALYPEMSETRPVVTKFKPQLQTPIERSLHYCHYF